MEKVKKTDPDDVLERIETEYQKRTVWLSRFNGSLLKLEFGFSTHPSSQYGFVLISLDEANEIANYLRNRTELFEDLNN